MNLLGREGVGVRVRAALGGVAWFASVGWVASGCGVTTDDSPGSPMGTGGCTAAGCESYLELTVADDGGTPGNRDDEYVVTVTVGERVGTCTLVIVEMPGSSERSNECSGDVPLELGSTDSFTGFTVGEAPETAHVVVTLDGATVYDETLTPAYAVNQPNGPDCEPTCQTASVPIEFE